MKGVPGDVARTITSHRSREFERCQHLSPLFRAQAVDLIAQVLVGDTPTDTPAPDEEPTLSCLILAGWTGLEPATSDVTGRRSNQLNYHPAKVVTAAGVRRQVRGLVGGVGLEPTTPGV